MIKVQNIHKSYITKKRKGIFKKEFNSVDAVKNVSMVIEKGKIVGLLGINGAGKTTTIKMLSTLLEPDKGSIQIDNYDLEKDSMKIKRKINMISGGERMLYYRLTAQENLWYYGSLYGIPKNILTDRISNILDLVGLKEKKDIPVERFSKGMKQRLQIARGLINDPDYIFMDEPTLGLDISIAKGVRQYIKKISKDKNKGILLTSHYINEVEELCDYIYIMHDGEIIYEGSPKSISNIIFDKQKTIIHINNITDKTRDILRCFSKDQKIEYSVDQDQITFKSDTDITETLVKMIHTNKINIASLYVDEPKLEDTIMEITRRIR